MIHFRSFGVMLLALSTMVFAQNQFTDVDPNQQGTNIPRTQLPQVNRGGLTFYTDQAAFEAAAPGLTQEDFASSLIGPNDICSDFNPLSSTTSDLCFAAGDLQPGFTITPDIPTEDYALLTTGFLQVEFNVVGPNTFVDDTVITLDDANAIGFDLVGDVVGPVTCTIEIYGAGGLLGTTTATGALSGLFWGVVSAEPITQVVLIEQGDGAELIGNMQYGTSGCSVSAISVNNDGYVTVSGSCPSGNCVEVWVSTDCTLTNVNSSNATFLGCIEPGVSVDLGFFPDSCYYAADAGGNVQARSGQTVPTLGETAMIIFVVMLMMAGMVYMRRRRLA